jgi:hypothetical protein
MLVGAFIALVHFLDGDDANIPVKVEEHSIMANPEPILKLGLISPKSACQLARSRGSPQASDSID